MTLSFSNILIPVDFSINTEIAVQKGLWLADPTHCCIHLLHIMKIVPQVSGYYAHELIIPALVLPEESKTQVELKLQEIKQTILKVMPHTDVIIHKVTGNHIEQSIIQFCIHLQPDLIVIGKNKNHNWIPFLKTVDSNTISRETKCPVLTVKPGGIPNRMKSIVIPVGSFIPSRKIELLTALTRNHRPRIHLVTLYSKNEFNSRSGIFLNTYRTLSDYLHYPVEYKMLRGKNLAKAILSYARSVTADILILDPYEESQINSISGAKINDLILPNSPLSILTAEPYHNN